MSTWLNSIKLFLSVPVDQLLAITAYGEAGGEGAEGMMSVLSVIRNRTQSSQFIDTEIYNATGSKYHAVILKKAQFSMYNVGNKVRAIAERIAKNFVGEVNSNSTLNKAYQLAQMCVSGILEDNTGGAVFYHATSVAPEWASTMTLLTQVGQHLFYTPEEIPVSEEIPTEEYSTEETPVEETTMVSLASVGQSPITWFLLIGMAAGVITILFNKR